MVAVLNAEVVEAAVGLENEVRLIPGLDRAGKEDGHQGRESRFFQGPAHARGKVQGVAGRLARLRTEVTHVESPDPEVVRGPRRGRRHRYGRVFPVSGQFQPEFPVAHGRARQVPPARTGRHRLDEGTEHPVQLVTHRWGDRLEGPTGGRRRRLVPSVLVIRHGTPSELNRSPPRSLRSRPTPSRRRTPRTPVPGLRTVPRASGPFGPRLPSSPVRDRTRKRPVGPCPG